MILLHTLWLPLVTLGQTGIYWTRIYLAIQVPVPHTISGSGLGRNLLGKVAHQSSDRDASVSSHLETIQFLLVHRRLSHPAIHITLNCSCQLERRSYQGTTGMLQLWFLPAGAFSPLWAKRQHFQELWPTIKMRCCPCLKMYMSSSDPTNTRCSPPTFFGIGQQRLCQGLPVWSQYKSPRPIRSLQPLHIPHHRCSHISLNFVTFCGSLFQKHGQLCALAQASFGQRDCSAGSASRLPQYFWLCSLSSLRLYFGGYFAICLGPWSAFPLVSTPSPTVRLNARTRRWKKLQCLPESLSQQLVWLEYANSSLSSPSSATGMSPF